MMFFMHSAAGQKLWEGKIGNKEKNPLASVSVILKDSTGRILTFARSREDGTFSISIPQLHNGFRLEFTSIGYKKKNILLSDHPHKIDITLEEDAVKLKDVIVKNRPALKSSGDTLIYNPADFADKQDRSIGDVLKKMPGISVDDAGKIEYNGKAISNFYIDGDNVLGSRYNIGTKSIPHDAVDRVQVIEKDQPIKMLRKNNRSEDVALNMVLKKEARLKIMGDASVGAGLPGKYDAGINTMLFRKKIKFLNSLKANNRGSDLRGELASHDFPGMKSSENIKPDAFLSAGSAQVPGLPQSRTLFNNAGMANLNNLFKLNEDFQVKVNAALFTDKRSMSYSRQTAIFLPGDTIRFKETQKNRIRPKIFQTSIDLVGNTDQYYFKNTLAINITGDKTISALKTNDQTANQNLENETVEFSNEFNIRKTVGQKNSIAFNSTLAKTSLDESLYLNPGINEDIFNGGVAYSGLTQYLKLPTWFANEQISFTHNSNNFFQTYTASHLFQKQQLASYLMKEVDNNEVSVEGNNQNNLDWRYTKWEAKAMYEYKTEKINASFQLPISQNIYHYEDNPLHFGNDQSFLLINPSFNFKYQTGTEHYLSLNYGHRVSTGNIENIYYGAILRDYRSLVSNDAPLGDRTSDVITATFNFKKSIQMIFFNIGTSYGNVSVNTISSYTIKDDQEKRIVIPLFNQNKSWSAFGSASKYLFDLASTFAIKANYSSSQMEQLQNEQLLPYVNHSLLLNASLNTKYNSKFNSEYDIRYNLSKSKSPGKGVNTSFRQMQQQLNLYFNFNNGIYLNASIQHLHSRQPGQQAMNYIFADAGTGYAMKKWNTDFSLTLKNIGNVKSFQATSLSSNSYVSGIYEIPGRMVMLSARFFIR